jgi:hypothetical protein
MSMLVATRLVGPIFVVGKDGAEHDLSVVTEGSKSVAPRRYNRIWNGLDFDVFGRKRGPNEKNVGRVKS